MTYNQIKEKVVDEEKLLTKQELNQLLFRLALALGGLLVNLTVLTVATVGLSFAVFVAIACILAFLATLDLLVEEDELLIKAQGYLRFWWLLYVLALGLFLFFKYFNFL